ncbi:MAG: MOSC domain-containing protein [Gammaproteobacteria bacterium]
MSGRLLFIFTAATPDVSMTAVDGAELETDAGLVGDRYYDGAGTFSRELAGLADSQVTLIESEEVDRFNADHDKSLGYGDVRRNLVTRGIRLNELVGRRFAVGTAVLEGIRLCEPCAHLARTVNAKVLPGLVHKAGLRARIVRGARIRTGDEVVPLDDVLPAKES